MGLVKIIESPRDAWQGLPKQMSPEVKAEYLRSLVVAGFTHIDAVSFVSKEAVPQMADSELVLEYLDAPDDVEIIGLVANAKGAERAVESGRVTTLAFPYSISPQFLERNQRQTPEEALDQLEQVGELAYKGGQDVVAYLSMAFGNPFGDAWDIDEVVSAVDLLVDLGVAQVVLADTAAAASPDMVRDVVACVLGVHEGLEVGVHLHARRENAAGLIAAAYEAGCRRFDATLGGVGGCPDALLGLEPDALIGNLPTEVVLATLAKLGAQVPDLDSVERLVLMSRGLEGRYGAKVQ
jgi:hydroxymethylglutaryl-CoA lyase